MSLLQAIRMRGQYGRPGTRECPAVAHGAAAGGEFRRSAQSFQL